MKNYNTYNTYKDSGEQWMGKIPEHWEVRKFKHVFKEKKKVLNPKLNSGAISFGEVVYKDDEKIPESTKASYQEVLEGEFLINPLNLNYDLISLRIALSKISVVVSSGYIVIQNTLDLNKRFYNYFLHRYDVAYMKLLGSGVRQTINFNHLANSLIAFPPLPEQQAIANFLDDKTSKIDQAITQKEALIDLLKERKQIIIQDLVTGKKVWNEEKQVWEKPRKVKDSGVEWIGEIPEDWEVKRLRNVISIMQTGTTPSTANQSYFNGKIDWYNPKDLNNEILFKAEKTVTKKAINDNQIKIFPGDSILIVGIGATTGKTSYMKNEGAFNQQITGLKSLTHSNLYLSYLLRSMSKTMLNVASYTTLPILNNEFFKSFIVCLPLLEEQSQIVAQIESESSKIDHAISIMEEEIERLKELKAVLIDSAVTGKIRVSYKY